MMASLIDVVEIDIDGRTFWVRPVSADVLKSKSVVAGEEPDGPGVGPPRDCHETRHDTSNTIGLTNWGIYGRTYKPGDTG